MQNQSSNTRIAKNTLALYFRMLLNMVVVFYTSRIVLDALGVEDYGIYNVVGGIVYLFTFLNTSMSSATQRFLTFEIGKKSDVNRMTKVFSTSLNIHVLISLAILILGETVGLYFLNAYMVIPHERIFAANWVYQCSVAACCVGIVALPFNAIIISYERMRVFAWISIFDVVLKLLIAYLLYLTAYDKLVVYSSLILLVSLITPLIYYSYCRKHFLECKFKLVKDKVLFKEMCNFAGWNLIGNLAYMGFTQGINILLNVFFGPVVNAARGVAVQVQGAVGQFSRNFQMAVNPQITKKYAAGDLKGMHTLLYRSSKFSFFLLLTISLPVILQTEKILNWWLVDVPDHTVNFFRIIICISMLDVFANPLNISAQATGKIKRYQLIEGGSLLLIVPVSYIVLCFFCIPELVFFVHLFIAAIVQVLRVLLLRRMICLQVRDYLRFVVFRISAVVMVIGLAIFIVDYLFRSLFDNFLACTFFSILISTFSIFVLGLTSVEKQHAWQFAKRCLYL